MSDSPEHCGVCGERLKIREGGPGRRRQYCDATCRSRARRRRQEGTLARTGLSPFATALAGAVRARSMALATLAGVMAEDGCRVSPSTLSNWQTGKNLPHNTWRDRAILLSLERALGLDTGTLVLAVRELAGRRLAVPAVPRGNDLPAREARLERRIWGLPGGAASRQDLVPVRTHERHVVGADRHPRLSRVTLELRALSAGITSYWLLLSVPRGEELQVRAGSGCQLGLRLDDRRRYPEAPEHLVAVELLLPGPLPEGGGCRLSYRVEYGVTHAGRRKAETSFRRVVTSPALRELDLVIEFDPSAVPQRLTQRTWAADLSRTTDHGEPVPGQPRNRLHLANPPVRGYGWVWAWPASGRGRSGALSA